jgi:hypothetical protein
MVRHLTEIIYVEVGESVFLKIYNWEKNKQGQ